jgi:F1F0 ATPase subunit 2
MDIVFTSNWIGILVSALAGMLVGAFYFGALRITVDRVPTSARPGALLLTSMIVRMAVALTAFYFVAVYGRRGGLLAGFIGFAVVRAAFLRRARSELSAPRSRTQRGRS